MPLESTIFPDLRIYSKKPLSEHTVQHWLIKLGWQCTLVKKGVYMDGHKREDIIRYRNEVFLPAMADYEAWMATYDGPELKTM